MLCGVRKEDGEQMRSRWLELVRWWPGLWEFISVPWLPVLWDLISWIWRL